MLRAARLLAEHAGTRRAGAALHLDKNLPVAAGVGGGSSDAAAAMRALCMLWRLAVDEPVLAALGAQLGADLPVCLYARAAWVGGAGERIEPAPDLPRAGILLANPRRPLATAAVFAARGGAFAAPVERFATMPSDAAGLARALACRRNDLTEAAIGLVPEIAAVLAALARLPGRLAHADERQRRHLFRAVRRSRRAEQAGALHSPRPSRTGGMPPAVWLPEPPFPDRFAARHWGVAKG